MPARRPGVRPSISRGTLPTKLPPTIPDRQIIFSTTRLYSVTVSLAQSKTLARFIWINDSRFIHIKNALRMNENLA